jgi:hypothetical protein
MMNVKTIEAHDLHFRLLNRIAPQYLLTYHYSYIKGYTSLNLVGITGRPKVEIERELLHIKKILETFRELMMKS